MWKLNMKGHLTLLGCDLGVRRISKELPVAHPCHGSRAAISAIRSQGLAIVMADRLKRNPKVRPFLPQSFQANLAPNIICILIFRHTDDHLHTLHGVHVHE